ncbi:alpha/beta hydrolase [Lyngbya confervoides]|uniref:Alpha/beta hydrolase n=1 Tax=Lyngbya confervoides BDU141951 TaxID=1574623 RepID=A0ABD4T0S9_9CYAN|nr:alpha/beta hydrolase [Lyngbya confervoides]MCM1981955.1 alpha/beta hydrolase [Lyngbya confervoides BDU141951]
MKHVYRRGLSALGVLLACAALRPVHAAERIYASYSLFERSISIEALEIFVREGRYTDNLITYGRFFKRGQLEQVRSGLRERVDLDPLTISQFLYTPIGERLLRRISEVVQPKSGQGGFFALRSALILAAAQEEGLTALNVLKQYPTQGIHVDLRTGLALFEEVQGLVAQTNQVVTAIESEAGKAEVSLSESWTLDLARPGPERWRRISLPLTDNSKKRLDYTGRSRSFPVDLYLPVLDQATARPMVVISHGLNSDRTSFVYLAEHLASWGYVVVVPEHPGSNKAQLEALLSGQANDVIDRMEFLDRPLDISFTLDQLEQLSTNTPDLAGRLDFNRVAVMGQSFGGYTALALAGAKLDFNQLSRDCAVNLDDTFNLSLLLQCLNLRIPVQDYQLADPRIKSVIAMNPIGSSLFGPQGLSDIAIPTMIVGGSADTVAPLVPEQVRPFSWLTTPQKYFVLINAGTHFSLIQVPEAEEEGNIPQLEAFWGRRPDIAQDYLKALGLAFMNRHLSGIESYQPFLSSGYGAVLSQPPLPLSILSGGLPPVLNPVLDSGTNPPQASQPGPLVFTQPPPEGSRN